MRTLLSRARNRRTTRTRLSIVLLTAAASGKAETWQSALPAAAAVELVHNFSLLHDDIQDNSEKRRGRPTAWTIWGVAQAINAGDGLLVLSNLAITDSGLAPLATIKNLKVLHLSGSPISDEGLAHLRGLKQLESLETAGTKVTPEGLTNLHKVLPKLKSE